MTTKAGVWIDHKQAIVVLITDAGQEINRIVFDIGQPVRSKGSARSKNDYVAEDKLERKVDNDRKDYFDDVITAIRGADSLWILGPGEAKGEFTKHLKAKKVRGVVVEGETADKMTERQLAAKVREHFAKAPTGNSVAPKAPGKRKTANDTSEKRTTRSGK